MDLPFSQSSDSINGFKFDEETVLPGFDPSQNLASGFKLKDGSLDFNLMNHDFVLPFPNPVNFPPSSSVSSEADSHDNNDSSNIFLKYINQVLMEEEMQEKPSMFHDPLALQAAEKSLYEVIGEKYSPLRSSSTNANNSASNLSSEADSPENRDSSDIFLKYINQILMEEKMEKPSTFHDPLALQAAEKSLYDIIGENYSPLRSSSRNSANSNAGNSSSEADSPENHDSSNIFLKDINQILMEENMEEKVSIFHDPLALQAAEKSLYEVIGEKYSPLPSQPPLYFDQHIKNLGGNFFGSPSTNSANSSVGNSINAEWIVDRGEYKSSVIQSHPLEYPFQSTLQTSSQWPFGSINSFGDNASSTVDLSTTLQTSSQWPFGSINSFGSTVSGTVDSSASSHVVSNMFSVHKSILQFKKGVADASKFLPNGNQLIIDLESYALPRKSIEGAPVVAVEIEKDERDYSPNGLMGRKNHHRENSDFQERSGKQSAVYVEEAELSEIFDKLLVCNGAACNVDEEMQSWQLHRSNGGKTRAKNLRNKKEVDMRNLLINCAQSVAADDRRSANEQLEQIREHSSPSGDGTQRLAHIFANGLEARLAGTGSQIYAALASNRISTAKKLKAYQLYLSACPFNKMAISFAVRKIMDLAEKATKNKLHIVDFGILYGFQWPVLFKNLSTIPGGPPKLRITGIELPQPGFRPAELVEETGRRLRKYCERFNVPFEYHAIAQKWETIKIEDLKIDSDEVLAVNCLFRFKNLLDETVVENSSRDAVLKLIRKLNPDIFIHSVVNGSHSVPFFVTRFREALFHYSAWFDMFDTIMTRDDLERLNLEKEFYGREVMNVIACEGLERVERPETYKQWQIRNMRSGFRLLPLDRELLKKLRGKVKAGYHKDFVIDEDGHWMLQGWKGRILCASSCWVPA